MAERPAHRHFAGVVPAVAHVDALAVVGGHAVTREIQIAGRVLQPQGPDLGQTPAGVGVAPQQGVRGLAQTLARQIHAQNRRYIVRPGALHRAGGVQHHDGVLLHGGHAGDQVVLAFGQAHVPPVRGGQLGAFGQTGKDDRGVRSFGGGHGTQELRLVALVTVRGEALDIMDLAVMQDRSVDGTCDLRRTGMTGGIARVVGEGADVGYLLPLVQRQCAQIAQEHTALLGQLDSQTAVCGAVTVRGGRLGRCGQKGAYNVRCSAI